jgi:hypothetical protein
VVQTWGVRSPLSQNEATVDWNFREGAPPY